MPPQTDRWPDDGELNVLYLFRGHETEWLGNQDRREGLVNVLQSLIISDVIRPLVVVMQGFMPVDRTIQGVPVNWSAETTDAGIGNGLLEDYFFEVKEWVETNLPVGIGPKHAALDGFSMGGYASLLLATRFPRLFCSVGAFDGSFMWSDRSDPRRVGKGNDDDRLWTSDSCAPYFDSPTGWDAERFNQHNPVALINAMRGADLRALKQIAFHIETVPAERFGNYDRCVFVHKALKARGLQSSFVGTEIVLDAKARHNWAWADRHLRRTLPLHDASLD
jgi:S-formylglutathione hydrolase FrmB